MYHVGTRCTLENQFRETYFNNTINYAVNSDRTKLEEITEEFQWIGRYRSGRYRLIKRKN